jgi:phage-related protein
MARDELVDAALMARAVLARFLTAGHNFPGPTPEDVDAAFWKLENALASLPPEPGLAANA